ncbi:MAG: M15 family peptidase [Candidatus Bathyarchaeia archaeon]
MIKEVKDNVKYKYSNNSLSKLFTCHRDLQVIFNNVILYIDCTIITGFRSEEEQNKAFNNGLSELKYPLSKHNKNPSLAIDVAPYPIDWNNLIRFYYFGGLVMGISNDLLKAGKITHEIRWGGDWDKDNDFSDQKFNDLVHFELKEI